MDYSRQISQFYSLRLPPSLEPSPYFLSWKNFQLRKCRFEFTINGQGGDMRVVSDRISFFGNSAGVDFVYFDLFEASGYTKGFARMEFNFGEEKSYSKVNCTKK